MHLIKVTNIALTALRLNKMRSFLTMLGIIIGIASVIVMVSISSGSKQEIEAQSTIAEVAGEKCVACGLCESICPYGAVAVELQRIGRDEREFAKVNPALCKGCGACVAGCRSGAINLRGFTDQQVLAEIMAL